MRATESASWSRSFFMLRGADRMGWACLLGVAGLILASAGCASPPRQNPGGTMVINSDQRDKLGGTGIESEDIRSAATKFAAAILSLPQIAQKPQGTGIAIAPVVNSSRHLIDKDLLTARLRIELNKYSQGRVRFFAQGAGQDVRTEVLAEKDRERLAQTMANSGGAVVSSSGDVRKPNSGLAGAGFILSPGTKGWGKGRQGKNGY